MRMHFHVYKLPRNLYVYVYVYLYIICLMCVLGTTGSECICMCVVCNVDQKYDVYIMGYILDAIQCPFLYRLKNTQTRALHKFPRSTEAQFVAFEMVCENEKHIRDVFSCRRIQDSMRLCISVSIKFGMNI